MDKPRQTRKQKKDWDSRQGGFKDSAPGRGETKGRRPSNDKAGSLASPGRTPPPGRVPDAAADSAVPRRRIWSCGEGCRSGAAAIGRRGRCPFPDIPLCGEAKPANRTPSEARINRPEGSPPSTQRPKRRKGHSTRVGCGAKEKVFRTRKDISHHRTRDGEKSGARKDSAAR